MYDVEREISEEIRDRCGMICISGVGFVLSAAVEVHAIVSDNLSHTMLGIVGVVGCAGIYSRNADMLSVLREERDQGDIFSVYETEFKDQI